MLLLAIALVVGLVILVAHVGGSIDIDPKLMIGGCCSLMPSTSCGLIFLRTAVEFPRSRSVPDHRPSEDSYAEGLSTPPISVVVPATTSSR
jgi:hypothetical protein